MDIYLVGGAVRDQLLGFPFSERDWVVVGATPAELLELNYQQVGKDFPVFLHPDNHEEYALARTERKQGHGYTGFECFSSPDVTLEQDLLRRDLTINAMAQANDGSLVDPYQGRQDLEQRILRHVSPAFAEDPLRVLRVARFAARYHHLGFAIAPETLALMQQISESGELQHLTAERVWQELVKALAEKNPEIFFQVLRDCHALKALIPELDALFGVPQPEQHHPEIDTGVHSLMALQQATQLSNQTSIRFAALMHDLGKGVTPAAEWPRHIAHEPKSGALVKQVCQRLKVPNDHSQLAELVARHHTRCHQALAMRPIKLLGLLEDLDLFRRPERLPPFLLACQADATGRTGFEHQPYPQAERLRQAFQACQGVSAKDLVDQGYRGPAVGEQLRKARLQAISASLKTQQSAQENP